MAGNRRGLHAYTVQEGQSAALGQAGSIHVRGTGVVTAPTGSVFVAIQFLEDTVFASDGDGLSAQDDGFFPDSQNNSPSISSNGVVTNSEVFPAGITIYGRWTGLKLASGGVMAYLG